MSDSRIDNNQENNVASYRGVLKSTSLFGSVQIYLIIIQIIRSKIIAVLLGPAGVGIQGLYTSATLFIRSVSSLGLSQSAVKDVSESNSSGNKERAGYIIQVVNKLVLYTGLSGAAIVTIFSPVLSKTSFGSFSYIIPFVLLSSTLLFDQLYDGQRVILQGTRQLKKLAKVSAYSATAALLFTIPFYYFWGVDGIVPALISNSIIAFLVIRQLAGSVNYPKVKVSLRQAIGEGKNMLKMGMAMSLSGIFGSVCAYILRGYIRYEDGTEAVGLYMAGFVIINTYVGLVFSAITTDYYPRLASVRDDKIKSREVVNQQGEIGVIILGPLLVLCVLIMPLAILILYSEEFMPAYDYIILSTLGMLFRLISVLPAFLFIVNNATKIYLFNEMLSGFNMTVLSVLFYNIWGLSGLGLSISLGYVLFIIQVYYLSHKLYNYSFTRSYIKLILKYGIVLLLCIIDVYIFPKPYSWLLGGLLFILSIIYAYLDLNKRLMINELLSRYLKK